MHSLHSYPRDRSNEQRRRSHISCASRRARARRASGPHDPRPAPQLWDTCCALPLCGPAIVTAAAIPLAPLARALLTSLPH
eukprot:575921-Prymnesium_polylepis.1